MSRNLKNSVNTKKLVEKIEKITKEKITKEKVVSLADYRNLKKKEEPKTILVVDDDETMRLALKRLFEAEGFRVLVAADGTQLSQVLDEHPLELIVLDIGLPWINGFELCKLLKENEERRKEVEAKVRSVGFKNIVTKYNDNPDEGVAMKLTSASGK